jgi:arylsulfatase A-like enzyme
MHHMLQPGEPCLLKRLKDAGYFVWWGGKNDLVAGQYGYDAYCDVKYEASSKKPLWAMDSESDWRGDVNSDSYYSFFVGKLPTDSQGDVYPDRDWEYVNAAAALIREWGALNAHAEEQQPLCIYLPITYPHPPYAVEEPWFSVIDRSRLPARIQEPLGADDKKPSVLRGIRYRQNLSRWTESRWDELRATYYGMCARVDAQFGVIVEALTDAGLYDDTALFAFSDHGDFTGDFGLVEKTQNTFEDCLTRVPLIIKPPAATNAVPRVCDTLVELVDIPATVEELAGLIATHTHFGRSLVPVVKGLADVHRDAVFCEGGRLDDEIEAMQLESGQDRERLYWPRLSLQVGTGPEHTKAVMCRTQTHKYVRRLGEQDELYDLVRDPAEEHNVIDDQEYREILSSLRDRMLTWFVATADVVPKCADARD